MAIFTKIVIFTKIRYMVDFCYKSTLNNEALYMDKLLKFSLEI